MALSNVSITDREDLARLASELMVVYEVSPVYRFGEGERRKIGFVLKLLGTHPTGRAMPVPGCPDCRAVWRGLRRIVEVVLPGPGRDSIYMVEPYSPTVHFDRARGMRPDVELTVSILHRTQYSSAIDACETRCLSEILTDLRRLGVEERAWTGACSVHLEGGGP